MELRDYYADLGIEPSSSPEEISRAYRQLARQYHPDVNPNNDDADKHFKEINEAYQVLSDPEKRAEYDLQRANHLASSVPADGLDEAWQERGPAARATSDAPGQVDVAWDGEDVGALLQQVADGVAREMREALLEFGDELESLSQMFRAGQPKRPTRQGFPPPPTRNRPPHHSRPPFNGKVPRP
jgi:curved DNA-binding protein CbpA